MANLIIKPTSGGSLVLQDEGGDAALTVGTTGNTTLAGTSNNLGTVAATTNFPAGHVIQVQSLTLDTPQEKASPTTKTWYDVPSFTLNITPSATSSKVMVMVVLQCSMDESQEVGFQLMRGSTSIGVGAASSNRTRVSSSMRMDAGSSSDYRTITNVINHLDSPSSTSATTYKLQWRNMYSTGFMYLNRSFQWDDTNDRSASCSTLTLMEIAG